MTNWQWQVILALIKIVLHDKDIDIQSLTDEKVREAENTLVEALLRSPND